MLGLESTPTNRKNVRRKVEQGLETLFKSRLSWTDAVYNHKSKTTEPTDFGDMRILQQRA